GSQDWRQTHRGAGRAEGTTRDATLTPPNATKLKPKGGRRLSLGFTLNRLGKRAVCGREVLRKSVPAWTNPPVRRFRSPHHYPPRIRDPSSGPKPHWINKLLVSFDSEVRKRTCRKMMRTSESGH